MYKSNSAVISFVSLVVLFTIFGSSSNAQEIVNAIAKGFPAVNVSEGSNGETQYSLSLQILALMTGLTVLPSLVLGMTSFTRVIIVLSILRQAMGTQQTPPNQVLIAIALFLTFFIMGPTLNLINDNAISPYLSETKSAEVALEDGSRIIKNFLVTNTRETDLLMFSDMNGDKSYTSRF